MPVSAQLKTVATESVWDFGVSLALVARQRNDVLGYCLRV